MKRASHLYGLLWFVALVTSTGLASQDGGPVAETSESRGQEAELDLSRSLAAFRRFGTVSCKYDLGVHVYLLPLELAAQMPELKSALDSVKRALDPGYRLDESPCRKLSDSLAKDGLPGRFGLERVVLGFIEARTARYGPVSLCREKLPGGKWRATLRLPDREVVYQPDVQHYWQQSRTNASMLMLDDILYPSLLEYPDPVYCQDSEDAAVVTWHKNSSTLQVYLRKHGAGWLVRSALVCVPSTTAVSLIDYDLTVERPYPSRVIQMNVQHTAQRCEFRVHKLRDFTLEATKGDLQVQVAPEATFSDQLERVPLKQPPVEVREWVKQLGAHRKGEERK